jgi:hypothetical protein
MCKITMIGLQMRLDGADATASVSLTSMLPMFLVALDWSPLLFSSLVSSMTWARSWGVPKFGARLALLALLVAVAALLLAQTHDLVDDVGLLDVQGLLLVGVCHLVAVAVHGVAPVLDPLGSPKFGAMLAHLALLVTVDDHLLTQASHLVTAASLIVGRALLLAQICQRVVDVGLDCAVDDALLVRAHRLVVPRDAV